VYSTNDDTGGGAQSLFDDDTFQRISAQLYKVFFSFAPALAGSAAWAYTPSLFCLCPRFAWFVSFCIL